MKRTPRETYLIGQAVRAGTLPLSLAPGQRVIVTLQRYTDNDVFESFTAPGSFVANANMGHCTILLDAGYRVLVDRRRVAPVHATTIREQLPAAPDVHVSRFGQRPACSMSCGRAADPECDGMCEDCYADAQREAEACYRSDVFDYEHDRGSR